VRATSQRTASYPSPWRLMWCELCIAATDDCYRRLRCMADVIPSQIFELFGARASGMMNFREKGACREEIAASATSGCTFCYVAKDGWSIANGSMEGLSLFQRRPRRHRSAMQRSRPPGAQATGTRVRKLPVADQAKQSKEAKEPITLTFSDNITTGRLIALAFSHRRGANYVQE
jgi:hypothetical protein